MECKSLEEVRRQIDTIDRQLVELLSRRGEFVKQASRFKKSSGEVKAPGRVAAVVEKVRALAEEFGGEPDLVEDVYRLMIDRFIKLEQKEFDQK